MENQKEEAAALDDRKSVSYTIRKIPVPVWRKFRHLSVERDISTNKLLIELIERAVNV